MNLNLGSAVKRLRAENGLTQEAVAEYLGISFQAVSKWETGANYTFACNRSQFWRQDRRSVFRRP